MTERLLQFIWQFQYFNKSELETTGGEPVHIYFPGQYNTDQGPDFSGAKLRIGKTTWAGNVELHVKSSDWKKHRHDGDRRYTNVILHVVWEDDAPSKKIPVLELGSRISRLLLHRYTALMESPSFIPCGRGISSLPSLHWEGWKQRLVVERMLRKAAVVKSHLQQNNYHWEEACWWMLARSFGARVNADAFESMARSLPFNWLARYRNYLPKLEALMMGQAGLLHEIPDEDYPQQLATEYRFLCRKHRLQPSHTRPLFLRMRPVNFPTIRLAQLAAIIHRTEHLFNTLHEAGSLPELRKWLDIKATGYWDYHYRFGEPSVCRIKQLGAGMIDTIIINTAVPIVFAYGDHLRNDDYKLKALQWLEGIAAESNPITKGFQQLKVECRSACDSQALIELRTHYCVPKRCVDCSVGNYLLRNSR